ncbi:hypothetical protein KR200_007914, partial [Drosophila serrata]
KMADKYSSDLCRVVIAQITQTIGYSSTLSAPLELLQDVMQKFMDEFARDLHGHMEHANRLEPSVKDARHSFKSLNINVQELLDYIGNVEPVGFTRDVPLFPIKRASNMNFLKPGSAETLTRPIHIFEYLPPMQETECRETERAEFTQKLEDLCANTEIVDKLGCFNHHNIESQSSNPATLHFPLSSNNNNVESDQNRSSMWELSSVVMTTGGFISPAIEGKLPETVVPDIIEEYKGLDAPPIAALIPTPLACSPKLETTSTRKIKAPLPEQEIDNEKQISATITATNVNSEPSLFNNNNLPTPKASTKKNKKQKDDLSRDKTDSKTQEKAQKKAMKLYQKLAKNESEESKMFNLKRSRKSADGNRAQQLEKLMRKEAKQRQKQLKGLTMEDKSLNYVENPESLNASVSFNTGNTEPVKSFTDPIPAVPANQNDHSSGLILAEAKKTCEPERNKLDIFKKITKQRMVLPPSNAFGKPIIAGNPPVISLPSGTTITPTNATTPLALPLIALNPETTIRNCNITEQKQSSKVYPIDMLVKPKKRGRKPGGKNQIKSTNLAASQSLINLPIPNLINSANTSSEQPLNLSNFTDQTVNLISKNVILKEKKERKKLKLKYETPTDKNAKEVNKNMAYTSPEKFSSLTKMNVVRDQFVTSPNATAAPMYSAHQGAAGAGMVAMPLLPLLHFPPQPGLIPTGPPPGIFPGVVPGLVGFGGGNNANKVGMPPFFAFSGPPDTSVAVKNDDATNLDQVNLFGRRSSENRNYCNVAPLIPPDTIKLTECGDVARVPTNVDNSYTMTLQKSKATGNLGDPIEVSDEESDEAIDKIETPKLFENKSELDLRNILPIPDKVKNFKSPVKLSLVGCAPPTTSSTSSISSSSTFPPRFELSTFMGGGDKFSLAGGADLIPLSRVDCGSAYSSQKVPSNSLTAQHNTNDDHQSFLPKFPTYEDITIIPTGVVSSTDLKQRKHHKKLKKIKEGKVKKKKDKKEKTKEKDLILGGGITTTSEKSDKKKKEKKKKEKQQTTSIIHIPDDDGNEGLPLTNNIVQHGPAPNLFVGTTPATAISPKSTPTPSPTQIPKLTLKLSGKSTPLPLPVGETMDIKTPPTIQRERDHSPELARFSPLVTGPPKTKQWNLAGYSPANPTAVQMPSLVPSPTNTRTLHPPMASAPSSWMSISNDSTNTHTSATCTLSANSVLLPQQLMLMTTPPKPNINNFPSTNVAAATTGRTSSSNSPAENPSQVLETKNHHRPSSYVDAEGNRIWICPSCGKVDDGSAMIGCDGCDAWYHWICVGITIAPKDNDDWFCRVCITKKKVGSSDKKAKKRNKKK